MDEAAGEEMTGRTLMEYDLMSDLTDTGRWTWLCRHDLTDTVKGIRQDVKGHYLHKDSVHLSDRRFVCRWSLSSHNHSCASQVF